MLCYKCNFLVLLTNTVLLFMLPFHLSRFCQFFTTLHHFYKVELNILSFSTGSVHLRRFAPNQLERRSEIVVKTRCRYYGLEDHRIPLLFDLQCSAVS